MTEIVIEHKQEEEIQHKKAKDMPMNTIFMHGNGDIFWITREAGNEEKRALCLYNSHKFTFDRGRLFSFGSEFLCTKVAKKVTINIEWE